MISLPFRRSPRNSSIDALYGMIVAQARCPAFYRDYGVPDTAAGRIDMIVLHLVILLRRLRAEKAEARAVGQQVFDRFCQDMDDSFREMGVGDLAVPKQMRRVAEAFYGRAKAYEEALGTGDGPALDAAVARNVFDQADVALGARRLAAYMRETATRLDGQEGDALIRGEVGFPDPEVIVSPVSREEQVP
jgi:cytochrome b pre-mRNA-processing protein 3